MIKVGAPKLETCYRNLINSYEKRPAEVNTTSEKKTLTLNEWIGLLLGLSLFFGVLVRFLPGLMAGFPLNDGGMFLNMIRDLHESRYILPEFTSYNRLSIPFAYPPFGFYFARLVTDLFPVSELDVLRWLPPLANTLSILAFYLLASELLKSKQLGVLASAFYALTPGAFGWFVMGGGLTRSFGSLFLLLTTYSVLQLFQSAKRKFIGLSVLFGGLAVLSHPEAGVHTAAICILLWLCFGRTIKSLAYAVIIGLGVLLVASPWWVTVISYHGLAPFLSALHTGSYGTPLWKSLYALIIGEGIIPILMFLRLIGLGWAVWRKQYFLLAWALVPYLVEPRSAPSVAFYPVTVLIALAFAEAIPYVVSRFRKKESPRGELHKNAIYNAALLSVLVLLFVDSSLYGFRLVGNSLKPTDLEAMIWIRENTPQDAYFLPLTGISSPEVDPVVEWFPALTERRSQATIQGLEWILEEGFFDRYADLAHLQSCETAVCVLEWSRSTGLTFDYLVVRKTGVNKGLLESFQNSKDFQRIYSNEGVYIFKWLTK